MIYKKIEDTIVFDISKIFGWGRSIELFTKSYRRHYVFDVTIHFILLVVLYDLIITIEFMRYIRTFMERMNYML